MAVTWDAAREDPHGDAQARMQHLCVSRGFMGERSIRAGGPPARQRSAGCAALRAAGVADANTVCANGVHGKACANLSSSGLSACTISWRTELHFKYK